MVIDTDVAWLAGIIDGEGCFSLKRPIARGDGSKGKTPYQLWIVLCNTSRTMVEKASRILKEAGIEHRPIRKVWKGVRATRWQYWLHVAKKEQVRKLAKLLLPYLIAKKDEAEIVIWYLDRACVDRAHKSTELERKMLDLLSIIKRNGGEAPAEIANRIREVIPSQATLGQSGVEGVETRSVSPNNNPIQECPAP